MVSIIVPIYNSILYVEECIQSLLSQTVDDLEVILIDDCSTDDVMSVIEPLVAKYEGKKIIRIHRNEKNLGSSATRNLGIEMAKGEYIGFVDCDHIIATNYVELMLSGFALAKNVGIIHCHSNIIKMVNGQYRYCHSSDENEQQETRLLTSEQYAEEILTEKISHTIWGKLFKREVIENIKFKEENLRDGFPFFVDIVEKNCRDEHYYIHLKYHIYYERYCQTLDWFKYGYHDSFQERVLQYEYVLEKALKINPTITNDIERNYLKKILTWVNEVIALGPNCRDSFFMLVDRLNKYSILHAITLLDNKQLFSTFLKIKYLPQLYWYLKLKRQKKISFANYKDTRLCISIGGDQTYIYISKAASTHLRSIALYEKTGIWLTNWPDETHIECGNFGVLQQLDINTCKKNLGKKIFAVYLDPFRRLVSTYQDKIKSGVPDGYFNKIGLGKDSSFKDFMCFVRKELKKKNPFCIERHVRPQHLFYSEAEVDLIIPGEFLNDFLIMNNIPIPPKKVNQSKKPNDYSEFELFREEIKKLYALDYKLLESSKLYNRAGE